jgi:hypothetical protein
MRVTISGTTITDHGNDLAAPCVEFPCNEPPLPFPVGWTVTGTSARRLLRNPDGSVRSVGADVEAEESNAALQSAPFGIYEAVEETVAGGFVSHRFAWTFADPEDFGADTGVNLFDLTDPTRPQPLESAVYAIAAMVRLESANQAGKFALPTLGLGNWGGSNILPLASAGYDPRVLLSVTAYLLDDQLIELNTSHSADGDLVFSASMFVQKITA